MQDVRKKEKAIALNYECIHDEHININPQGELRELMKKYIYKDFIISLEKLFTPMPEYDWIYRHIDYYGPEDFRAGHSLTYEGCIELIDEYYEENGE